jgi:uncharacterized membrane protein YccC
MAVESASRSSGEFWRTTARVDRAKINGIWLSLRNSLAVGLPLAIGIAMGNPLGGVAVSTGALNVSFSDGQDPYRRRAYRMLLWSALGALSVFVGSATGNHFFTNLLVVAAWAFAAGMLIAISSNAGDLGLNTLVSLIVFAARGAMSAKGAFYASLLVFGGGLLQTLFALLLWPVRRYEPERLTIGGVYQTLAREVDPYSDSSISTPLTALSTEAQDTIDALSRDHSLDGERFRMLFDQADRLRLSIYLVSRLRDALGEGDTQRSEAEGDAAAHLDALLSLTSALLAEVGESLLRDRPSDAFPAQLADLHAQLEHAHAQKDSQVFPLAASIAQALDVLAGQLRVVVQLTGNTAPEGAREFTRREHLAPLKLQLSSWAATLRAHLDFRSAICRHAVRLSLCVALGSALEGSIGWQRAYWLPMTVAVVLKPDFTATFSRGVLRLLGTLAGLLLSTALYHLLPPTALAQLFLVSLFTFFLRYLGPANYGVFTVAISGLVVFLIAATGINPQEVIVARGVNTAAGGLLALAAYALWPTWEITQVPEALAEMLDANRRYFRAIIQRFDADDPALDAELDDARREWRRTRSMAEASVDRIRVEPGTSAARRDILAGILASSHIVVHAAMGLEAGALKTKTRTSPEALRTFGNHVELTLYYLAAALRGSHFAGQTLPLLREDHRRMVEARGTFAAVDEYILIETDRLTVSLNTLREQVSRFVNFA